jgi:hypothetical protein
VGRWTCPACDREFARAHQSHVCVPGGTVDESFAGRPPVQRAIYEAVADYLRTVGPFHVDAVMVGVFFKRERTFVEARPQARSLSLSLALPRRLDHPRVARRLPMPAGRVAHVVKLTAVEEVDDDLRGWLAEAYHAAGA